MGIFSTIGSIVGIGERIGIFGGDDEEKKSSSENKPKPLTSRDHAYQDFHNELRSQGIRSIHMSNPKSKQLGLWSWYLKEKKGISLQGQELSYYNSDRITFEDLKKQKSPVPGTVGIASLGEVFTNSDGGINILSIILIVVGIFGLKKFLE